MRLPDAGTPSLSLRCQARDRDQPTGSIEPGCGNVAFTDEEFHPFTTGTASWSSSQRARPRRRSAEATAT
jgi:hypothetical protein